MKSALNVDGVEKQKVLKQKPVTKKIKRKKRNFKFFKLFIFVFLIFLIWYGAL